MTLWRDVPAVGQALRGEAPATNNVTERAAGRTKARCKTTHGLKSSEGYLKAFALTQWLYTPAAQHDGALLLQGA